MSNAATPRPSRFEEEWTELIVAPTATRGKADLQEAALIVTNVRPEMTITWKLLTTTALPPFGCEGIMIKHGEYEDRSAGKLVVSRLPIETMNNGQ